MAWRRDRARTVAAGDEHRVTPAELFFDLVFVYAITQVTALMAADPSPVRVADTGHYDLAEPLHGGVARSLTGGVGVFPLGGAAIVLRSSGRRPTVLAVGGVCALASGAHVGLVPALVALAALAAGLTALVAPHGRGAAAPSGHEAG